MNKRDIWNALVDENENTSPTITPERRNAIYEADVYINELETALRSIGIAYSEYIRIPNDENFTRLMDLARAALESEAANG